MGRIAEHLGRSTRRMPAVIGGTLDRGFVQVEALGRIAAEAGPGSLAWEIGSITKVFTGVLLAEMSIRGEVALDDPIGLHVPESVAAALSVDQPTLADLATHRSGLPRIPRSWLKLLKGHPDPYSVISAQDVWDAISADPPTPRRDRPRYSNLGAGLLGLLLGRAAGNTYEALVTERILEPLHMSSTGFGATPVPGFRKGEPTPPWTFQALAAAGGLRSTIDDMVRFARAVIYPPEATLGAAIRLARTPVWEGRVRAMGLGWQTRRRPGGEEALWHNGGTYATSSFLAVHPSEERAVIAFGNSGPGWFTPLDGPSWRLYDAL